MTSPKIFFKIFKGRDLISLPYFYYPYCNKKSINFLIKRRTKMKYKDLFKGTRSERVASFLALLELIKLSKVKFYEEDDGITITDGEAK